MLFRREAMDKCPHCGKSLNSTVKREPDATAILWFPIVGKEKLWPLEISFVRECSEVYQNRIDVLEEFRKARMWCKSNTQKQKTARGMRRFLNSWLDRAVNNGTGAPPLPKKEARAAMLRMKEAAKADEEQAMRARSASMREPGNITRLAISGDAAKD